MGLCACNKFEFWNDWPKFQSNQIYLKHIRWTLKIDVKTSTKILAL